MKATTRIAVILLVVALLPACATLETTRAPGADISRIRTLYVEKLEKDERGVDSLIAAQLNKMGLKATNGPATRTPANVDAVVTYADRWMWDITMYMLSLNIQVRDGKTRAILASSQSVRPSLVRKDPEAMVEEVVADLFKK